MSSTGSRPPRLKDFLETTFANAGGSLSFERFMELALYDPQFGYYSANIADVGGERADFSTWATLADLGTPLANWIRKEIPTVDWNRQKPNLIEIGAGDGSLAAGILKQFGWLERRKLNYHIVDRSGPLREKQRQKLKGKGVSWHESMQSALAACDGRAIIFSNELVDAFPVTWLRWNGGNWEEIYVDFSPEKGLGENFVAIDIEIDWENPPPGQRVEFHRSYFDWQKGWLPDFKCGSILTIDYGDSGTEKIYRNHRNGTLRGYHRQQRIEGPGVYQRFGKQDLTADVDFAELIRHGEWSGLETVKLENQRQFLERFGTGRVISDEAAEAFQVLHQKKLLVENS